MKVGKLEMVKELKCECGSKDFLVGPRGGLSVNIKCVKCGRIMNVVCGPNGKYLVERIYE